MIVRAVDTSVTKYNIKPVSNNDRLQIPIVSKLVYITKRTWVNII